MVIYKENKKFYEYKYDKEAQYESDIVKNSNMFFGENSIYIDSKKKIKSKALGNSIPDGFLIDLSDIENPEFYIVEVELYKHDFYSHIFPQLTKFFAFYKNLESRIELTNKIYTIINEDESISNIIKEKIGRLELYKFLQDMIENSQNILLILDNDKKELPEIINTYSEWGKMVKVQIIKKFESSNEHIFSMVPEFEAIEFSTDKNVEEAEKENLGLSEDFHLDNKPQELKLLYQALKQKILNINNKIIINPQRYYISIVNNRNIAYLKLRRKKIRVIIMLHEDDVREKVKYSSVKSLSQSVQNFYNGDCVAVDLTEISYIDELISVLEALLI